MGAGVPVYKQPGVPIPDRVNDLLSRMTLQEKINQMALPFGAQYPADYAQYNATGLGATYPLRPLPNTTWVETRNQWQRWQVENSRLGIPTSFISETLHSGYSGGTIFPMPSLQGCTWNPQLVQAAAEVIAMEASASGVDRGFSPVLHFCTDPRFGRCEESFGEDPMLLSKLGQAAVTGLAGPGKAGAADEYIADPTTKIATEAKHYAAYGYGGRDGSMPAEISDNVLYDVYLKPWRAYARAGGRGIMAAHNEVNGMPCHGNAELLGALRNKFGFGNGLCASDAGDINSIAGYRVARNKSEAGAIAVKAGMDQELDRDGAFTELPAALASGLVNETDIDRAAGNVLRQKFASGLFDNRPELLYVDAAKQAAALDLPSSRALARKIADEGIVLLKNDGGRAGQKLPLSGLGTTIRRVAVIGPNADNEHSTMGGYTESGAEVVTVLDAVVMAANASLNKWTVEYTKGACLGATPGCPCPIPTDPTVAPCGVYDTEYIPAASEVAARSDVVVLVLGDSSTILAGDSAKHHETGTCGEHFDRDDLDPPGAQLALLQAVLNASDNVVVVMIGGRPSTFGASHTDGYNAAFASSAAVLAAWRPGEEAGNAVWGILNGTVNPSGRSAHTWPTTVGQVHQYVPWYLPTRTRSRSNPYADMATAEPLVPFGYGLSYTTFTLSEAKLTVSTVGPTDTFNVTVSIKGDGPAGLCVVQVYFSQEYSTRVRYDQMLLGFAKVAVPANGNTVASIPLLASDLEMYDRTVGDYVVEPSDYNLYVGLYSTDPKAQHLSLTVQT
eukprot:CAMPEP_0182916124 /NCGR_PEP_ID=MMETSP0105_2-20130417/756_1 /TAXON_ID=81532 ORGANISM="Acanthoeca-like sp., Strain 10tr" /NCGR_SAMPLE_ID=MMETSP0105_2 /ASSEMBLY_ACC=CAM_ASM_000205 /LENGTH=786 /DNA_ID=CAMNT_0025053053 /DNA_START=1 /DNA_END=2361 /DNA_ORIENTATION=-